MTEAPPLDPRDELRELVRSARALLRVHGDAGTSGLPRGSLPVAAVAEGQGAAVDAPEPKAPAPVSLPSPPGLQPLGPALRAVPSLAREASLPPPAAPAPSSNVVALPGVLRGPAPPPAAVAPLALVAPAPGGDEARARLRVIQAAAAVCTRCELHEGRHQSVFSRGDPGAGLLFVGEGPGADEDRLGEPFVGQAGQLLDKMIAAMGLERGAVYIANVVKCRPPNNRTPTPAEMAACLPYLTEQIALIQPRVIVALGATAARALLATSIGIRSLRGQWKLYQGTIPVMPTFHPAFLLREPSAKKDVWQDLQAVLERLGHQRPRRGEP